MLLPDLLLFSGSQADLLRTFLRLIVPVLFLPFEPTSISIGVLSGSNAIRLNFLLRFVLGLTGEKFSLTESVSMLSFLLLLTAPGSKKAFLLAPPPDCEKLLSELGRRSEMEKISA